MPEGVDITAGRQRPTYYGRPQLKPAPFNKALVGTYVFLSGLSGAAALLSALLDLTRGRAAARAVRRGRYLALLAPTIGAGCLIADLHTPQRFYNMLRVFKRTSPMSIGSWLLVAFGAASVATAAAQFVADRGRLFGWLRWIARATQVPAAAAGAGLATYTATLLSATSTPLWAAAPRALAVRFGAASVAAASAAMGMAERRSRTGRDLDSVAVAALAAELAATLAAEERYRSSGVLPAMESAPVEADRLLGIGIGTLAPLGLHAASLVFTRRRSRLLSLAASSAILAGGLAMRCSIMAMGNVSAARPDVSLRFAGEQQRTLAARGGNVGKAAIN